MKPDKKPRRQHGKAGWTKETCYYSRTGWAWYLNGNCTCVPCTPLKEKE